MLARFLKQLCTELEIDETPRLNEQKIYPFKIGKELVAIQDLDPGFGLQAHIGPCPKKKKEELFIFLMRANLLGQGTGGARIGMDPDGNLLTLSLGMPYEMNYQKFKETIEDFVNYLIYWRDTVAKFESEKSVY